LHKGTTPLVHCTLEVVVVLLLMLLLVVVVLLLPWLHTAANEPSDEDSRSLRQCFCCFVVKLSQCTTQQKALSRSMTTKNAIPMIVTGDFVS